MTLKARYCLALSAFGLAASAPLASVGAQSTRTPDPNAPRLMVGVFRSADKNVGVQAADAIRSRINQDVPLKQLWVIPKQDITATLEASGFPTTEALAPHDARALAQLLRADAYVVGNVVRDSAGSGYVVNAQYVLTRDNSLVQPLPPVRVDKADKAANAVSREFREAHKQFDEERQCVNLAREGKYAEAATAARKGIAEYANSTLARICLANVMKELKAPGDSVLAIANQVLAIDPRSRPALTVVYDAHKTAGRAEQATDALLRLVAADPSNARLLEQVVNELAASGQAAKAIPFVKQLVTENPGDPSFVGLQMRVMLAARDYKGGIAAGEELMKLDTAATNVELFRRLAAAAVIDSQPQLAAQIIARGVAKFPNSSELQLEHADALRAAGQPQQAIAALDKVAAANPKTPGLFTTRARLLADMNRADDALASLQQAVSNGDSAGVVARYAVGLGQNAYRAANASKERADYERAIRFLEFANTTSRTPEGAFLLGAASLSLGAQHLQDAQKNQKQKASACQSARSAKSAFETASVNIPEGGKFNPQAAQQLLAQLGQFSPYADQFVKALCK
jgi:tetratricopeptide (TPR) repeat protein